MTTTHQPPRHNASGRHHPGPLLLAQLAVSLLLWALIIWVFRTVVG